MSLFTPAVLSGIKFALFRTDARFGYCASSVDLVQTPQTAASDQGQHCLNSGNFNVKYSKVDTTSFWHQLPTGTCESVIYLQYCLDRILCKQCRPSSDATERGV